MSALDKVNPQPFLTAVAGHVLIHDGLTGNPLPGHWTGFCTDAYDTKSFWYIGCEGAERSFTKLASKNLDGAQREMALIEKIRLYEDTIREADVVLKAARDELDRLVLLESNQSPEEQATSPGMKG